MRQAGARGWTKAEKARLVRMHLDGKSLTEMSEALGRGYRATQMALYRAGYGYAGPRRGQDKKVCLRCDREFMSEGIYNRVCPTCRDRNENHDHRMIPWAAGFQVRKGIEVEA